MEFSRAPRVASARSLSATCVKADRVCTVNTTSCMTFLPEAGCSATHCPIAFIQHPTSNTPPIIQLHILHPFILPSSHPPYKNKHGVSFTQLNGHQPLSLLPSKGAPPLTPFPVIRPRPFFLFLKSNTHSPALHSIAFHFPPHSSLFPFSSARYVCKYTFSLNNA